MPTRDSLNAFLELPDIPVEHAETGPLSGFTLGVKDIYDVAGYPTGGGNPQRQSESGSATSTAPAVKKLLDAGAQFVGKTQTDELTFSLFGLNTHYPHPVNPAAPDRITGGSSSGSAAAVAGGLADIATGSDTGGSVRAPAAMCGLVGLRTTHGRITLQGAMGLAPSLDTFGWFAKSVELYETVGTVLLGADGFATPLGRVLSCQAVDSLVLGPDEASEYNRIRDQVAAVIGDPDTTPAFATSVDDLYMCFRRLQAREAWDYHGEWIAAADRGLGPDVRERFEFGTTVDDATVAAETTRRNEFRNEFGDRLGTDAVLLLPTLPSAAPLKADAFEAHQAWRERALRLLCLSGLSGFPQITLPLGIVDGAPFGISLIGPPGRDMSLIGMARDILRDTGAQIR